MGRYVGETYNIPLEKGGFCHNKNIDTIAPEDMVHPSKNVWLNEGGIRKRGGTTPVDTNIMFTIPDPTFDGSGLDDMSSGTVFTHTEIGTFTITISATGAQDKFDWTCVGSDWIYEADNVGITGGEQTLCYGFKVTFAAITGHTINDKWTVAIDAPEVMGIYHHVLASGTEKTVRVTADGKFWKDNANAIKTGLGTSKVPYFSQWGDYVIVANGNVVPFYWNGVAAAPTDFSRSAVKAKGTITLTGIAQADEVFTINKQEFTWKAARSEKGEVTIGGDGAASVTNIVTAIELDINDDVTATDGAGDTVVVEYKTVGSGGNSIVFTESSTNMAMDGSGVLGGTTTGLGTRVPADWTGINYPKQIVMHGRGNSMRGWGVGCVLNPKNVYVSVNDNPTDFSQETVLVFQIETGDGAGIVAGIEYGDRLFLFGKTHSFVFNDDETDTTKWGYVAAQWDGGVAHHRLLVKTPNDLIAMMANGEIYSIATAEQYGDYKAASLTRPSFMHEWIKTYVKLSAISDFHAIYDPILRAVKIFVVRSGENTINTCLCYFIDRPPEKAWVVLDNIDLESGYSASCAALAKLTTGWKLYTGGYNGKVWKLGETNRNDNGNAFQTRYKTPAMGFGNIRESKRYDDVRVIAVNEGTCAATLRWLVNGQEKGTDNLEFSAGGGLLGSFILGQSPLGGINILEKVIKLGCMGERLQLEIINNTANENFFFSQLLVDFLPLGKRP